ncbi:MAG TPA: thioredoxin domain-containing protein [Rhodanobacteraceae bacterium]|nr:thioredoxin domain-containing protein [Rhodanobacteraceae bacterium]
MAIPEFDDNRLADASSPYLRQHAGNPVHWQIWNDVTLAHARASDMPILLSIGYSACHWCHVMAHECFENAGIAAAMNAAFVNIKLDREERPDIDRVYQLAHQALTGRGGGWPLTAFLDPQDLVPFYIGTYFPPTPRHGLPGFPAILERVRAYFDSHRGELREQAGRLREWVQRVEAGVSGSTPDANSTNTEAMQRLAARFDSRWGGNAGAPKFPRAAELEWLLDPSPPGRRWRAAPDEASGSPDPHPCPSPGGRGVLKHAHRTLRMMATRGLQDHLGGGFFRYCVDAEWTIPHFEKMLYDNAQLLPAYARLAVSEHADAALRVTSRNAVLGIAGWLSRDMTAPDGAFYSSLDADSEHEEGKFYLWTRDQVQSLMPDAEFAVAERAFDLDKPPNFEGKAWHLLREVPLQTIAGETGGSVAKTEARFAAARRMLFEAREQREHPAHDDKILTAWNALAISGLARAARLLDDAHLAAMARRALDALRASIWIDGELFANAADPASRVPGFLDDHAFLLDALLESLQFEFEPRDLDWATAIADALCAKFSDPDSGGFWFSTERHATPLARGRNWTDDALPNGNAIAIRSLLRLGHLIGETRYLDTAERALRAGSAALDQYPEACPSLLLALIEFERPRPQIVVRCPQSHRSKWQETLRDGLRSAGLALGGDPVDAFIIPSECDALPGVLAARETRGNTGTAWVCSGMTCQAPVTSPGEFAHTLRAAIAG